MRRLKFMIMGVKVFCFLVPLLKMMSFSAFFLVAPTDSVIKRGGVYIRCIMMLETALRDFNLLPKSERTNETSSKDVLDKPYVENVKGKQRISIVTLDEPKSEVADSGAEVVAAEVEYIESEKLDDLENLDESLKVLVVGLDSKDWVLLCDTLNDVRRLAIYHKEALQDILENVISLVVKALKNPRSVVCKTAIMNSADIFKAFGDSIIYSVDPLLVVRKRLQI